MADYPAPDFILETQGVNTDNVTAQFLLESLRPPAPVIPRPYDPMVDFQRGLSVAEQLAALQKAAKDANDPDKTALNNAHIALLKAQTDYYTGRGQTAADKATPIRHQVFPPFDPAAYSRGGGSLPTDGTEPPLPAQQDDGSAAPPTQDAPSVLDTLGPVFQDPNSPPEDPNAEHVDDAMKLGVSNYAPPDAGSDIPTYDGTAAASAVLGGPMAEVNNAFNPDGTVRASAIHNAPAATPVLTDLPQAVTVPQTQEEADALRDAADTHLSRVMATPGLGNDSDVRAQATLFGRQVNQAIGQFQRNRTNAERLAARPSAAARTPNYVPPDTLDDLVRSGYVPESIEGKSADGLTYKLKPADAGSKLNDDLDRLFGTHDLGAIKAADNFNHRNPDTGEIDPDRVFFQFSGAGGLPATKSITNEQYEVGYRAPVNRYYGVQSAVPVAPPVLASTNRFRPIGNLTPVRLAMGPLGAPVTVPDASYIPPTTVSDIPPTTARISSPTPPANPLAAAALTVKPGTDAEIAAQDSLKKLRASTADADAQDAQDKLDAQVANTNRGTASYQMATRVQPIEDEIHALNQRLAWIQDFKQKGANSRSLSTMPFQDQRPDAEGEIAQRIAELRARRQAIVDPKQYQKNPDGTFKFLDPLRTETLPDGFASSAGGVKTTRTVTQ